MLRWNRSRHSASILNETKEIEPEWRDRRQHLVQRGRKMGVMGEPVGQRLDIALELIHPPACPDHQVRPARKARREIGRIVSIRTLAEALGHVRKPRDHRALGSFGQQGGLHLEALSQSGQKLAADSAAVVLDEIEIGGRYADMRGQLGLLESLGNSPLPDPAARQRAFCHRFFLVLSRAFCIAT